MEPDAEDDDDLPVAKLARRQSGTSASRFKVRPEEAAAYLRTQKQVPIARPLPHRSLSTSPQGSTGASSLGLSEYDRKPAAVGRAAGYGRAMQCARSSIAASSQASAPDTDPQLFSFTHSASRPRDSSSEERHAWLMTIRDKVGQGGCVRHRFFEATVSLLAHGIWRTCVFNSKNGRQRIQSTILRPCTFPSRPGASLRLLKSRCDVCAT